LILFIVLPGIYLSAQCPFGKKIKRIVFLGNSITYDGRYITDIETYFVQHYPACTYEFINVGLPSETVSGLTEDGHAGGRFPRPDLHERLKKVLGKTKPDLVFACYGMNDGIYLPLNDERFQAFKNGIIWLHKSLDSAGIKKIIFFTPPVHDDKILRTKGYNRVLNAYSEWLVSFAKNQKWELIDLHKSMTDYLNAQIAADSSFRFAPDQVHPDDAGHWFMAKTILKGLGQTVKEDQKMELGSTDVDRKLFELIKTRQAFMKDAWLSATGHLRPEMRPGMPLNEAKKKYSGIDKQIRSLQRQVKSR
jgi:lysophospholipase L1-like esterase